MPRRSLALAVVAVLTLACSDHQLMQQSPTRLVNGVPQSSLLTDGQLTELMGLIFLEGDEPADELRQMLELVNQESPDTSAAQALAWEIVDHTITLFKAKQVRDPDTPETLQNVLDFGNGVLERVGLPPGLTAAALERAPSLSRTV